MPEGRSREATPDLEAALDDWRVARFCLQLFVAGGSGRSTQAVENLKSLCESYLAGRYELTVVDVYQQPQTAQEQQLVAAPTLVKLHPPPLRQLVGDLSDHHRVLLCLGIHLCGENRPQAGDDHGR